MALGLTQTAGALDLDTLQAMKKQAERLGPPDIVDVSQAKRLCLCELGPASQMLGFVVTRNLVGGAIVGLDCAVPEYNPSRTAGARRHYGRVHWGCHLFNSGWGALDRAPLASTVSHSRLTSSAMIVCGGTVPYRVT